MANGIEIELQAYESKNVEFKVTVGDLDNGAEISNKATVDTDVDNPNNPEEETETAENTYVEAIINATKEMSSEYGLDYLVKGERITYTIIIENNGDLGQDVVVKDSVPEGTTFVEGSIKVKGR